MSQSLIIFDYSGSMQGTRYQTCREACKKFTQPFEFWLFGSGIEKRGVVSTIPEFPCSSGTDITNMLNTLYEWMRANKDKYVYLLTDGEASYDEHHFTQLFDSVVNNNHQVTVYDICGTNVEPLKRIFAKFGIQVLTELADVDNLISSMQILMKKDKEILKTTSEIDSKVSVLVSNFEKLAQKSNELKITSVKIEAKSKTITNQAEKALFDKAKQNLTKAGEDLKVHLVEVASHLRKLKENEKEAKKLELELDDIQDDMDEVQCNIKTEVNAGVLTNQQKITSYDAKLNDLTDKKYKLMGKINTIKGESSAMIKRFKELQEKTSELQLKVTQALGS